MKTKLLQSKFTSGGRVALRVVSLLLWAGLILIGTVEAAVPPNPIVEMQFSEGPNGTGGNGVTTTNAGNLEGLATFVQPTDPPWEGEGSTNIWPAFTNNVPTGTYVPAGNTLAVNFGPGQGNSLGGSHGRAIDLNTTWGASHPTLAKGTLGACPKLTICGWLNAMQIIGLTGGGGNRITHALETPNGYGFDLVQRVQGQLSLIINQYNDASPESSPGMITENINMPSNNWVYFAVTYDPDLTTDHVKYYFGKSWKLAQLDVSRTYPTPSLGLALPFTGLLTVGNFGELESARDAVGGNNNRVFKGLMDEIRIYTNVLTIDEIQQAQVNGAVPSTPATFLKEPVDTVVQDGQTAVFSADANGSGTVTYQWRTNGVAIPGATGKTFTWTAIPIAYNGTLVSVLIDNPALADPGLASSNATLIVIPNDPRIISVSFTDGGPGYISNQGALAGRGRVNLVGGFPQLISTNVPTGPYAPSAAHNTRSLNMGLVNGGYRAVDITNTLVSPVGALGSMNALTICGWLNSANNSFRTTSTGRGTAVVNASLGGSAGGFALGYRDNLFSINSGAYNQNYNGRLVLHINEWDTDPVVAASSADTILINTNLPAENWVFFAVTYDGQASTDNVKFYFGNANQEATNDVTITYDKGPIAATGPLSIGNHNPAAGGAYNTVMSGNPTGRNINGDNGTGWRGLMDEIKIYSKVLTLAEIREQQKAPALPPYLLTATATNNIVLSWDGPFQLQSKTDLTTGSWVDVTTATNVSGSVRSLGLPLSGDQKFFRLR